MSEPRVVTRSIEIEGAPKALMLRDDLLHPWAGGNKLRKLDALLPHLLATQDPEGLITLGGVQSAHCAAVACVGAGLGLSVDVALRGERPEVLTGNALVTHMFARSVTWVDRDAYAGREQLARQLLAARPGSALIPEGAGAPLALCGCARLIGELAGTLPCPEAPWRLILDAATGTTTAGLALGILLHALPWHIEAVALMSGGSHTLGADVSAMLSWWGHDLAPDELPLSAHERLRARRFGKVYADEPGRCAEIAQRTGVLFDPIYTLAAYEHARARPSEHMLVVHTGGGLNLFGVAQRHPGWMP